MIELQVDYEAIRELLLEMGEEFEACGFSKVLEDFEGSGNIGKAVASPRDAKAIYIIHTYMKSIAKSLLAEEALLKKQLQRAPYLRGNPQFEKSVKCVLEAKKSLDETFQQLKECVREPDVMDRERGNSAIVRTVKAAAVPLPAASPKVQPALLRGSASQRALAARALPPRR